MTGGITLIRKRVSQGVLTLLLAMGPVLGGAATHAWADGNGNGSGNGDQENADAELPVGTLGGVGLAGVLTVAVLGRKGVKRAVVRIRRSA
jgi:hypothetical protein